MRMKIKSESGVTLIALVTTIIIIIILAGITINIGSENITRSADNRMKSELGIVQHAILQRKTKIELTGETPPGSQNDEDKYDEKMEVMRTYLETKGINLKDSNEANYYLITQKNAGELGLSNLEYEYIVNYKTGEVFNSTKQKTNAEEVLYIYAKSNE